MQTSRCPRRWGDLSDRQHRAIIVVGAITTIVRPVGQIAYDVRGRRR